MKLDLEAFEVLKVLVEQGSFAKAAEQLHKAQSAVSYQIKKLESQLGIELFDRSQYRAQLTPEGQAVLEEGQRLLQQAQHIEEMAQRFGQGWEASLSVIIDGALPSAPVMRAIKTLAERQLTTRVQLKMEFLSGVSRRFERDNADLMLALDYQAHAGYQASALPEITSVLVANRSHPLSRQANIRLADLQQHLELTILDSALDESNRNDPLLFDSERVFYLSSFDDKKQALLMGLGYGWMPKYLIEDELVHGELVQLDYRPGNSYRFRPMLVQNANRSLGRAGQLLKALLEQEFEAALGQGDLLQ
ncbi:LysR family transcriptional regulator [Paraferrimonas sedimenticola]|uniref:LysR family transcriptional regulator n=1 Tax=Paraferrimonas sedimenticola TaxID=375674 RepID=A0AA37W2D8_9GAMM|nr:LysR family transcriptional regulator [Paraferrimonas sedimenticola]GLP97930.1 LysR family transcriptional regulator [Paraferrimonas sedimenticola]